MYVYMYKDLTDYCKYVTIEMTMIDIHSSNALVSVAGVHSCFLKFSSRLIKYSLKDSKICKKTVRHEILWTKVVPASGADHRR